MYIVIAFIIVVVLMFATGGSDDPAGSGCSGYYQTSAEC